jgi:cold shock CspA family protein
MNIEVKTGVLKHFAGRGFGFIQVIENGIFVDVFFHISSVLEGHPTAGAIAEFNDGVAKGRRVAVNVRFVKPQIASVSTADYMLAGRTQ